MTETRKPADQIRDALKAAGIKRAQVSVRHEYYSMGSTIHVVIKDAAVKKSVVEKIANAQEHVRWDEFAGEILSGGNRFVRVDYSGAALALLATEFQPLFDVLPKDGSAIQIRDGEYVAYRGGDGRDFTVVIDRSGKEVVHCWSGIGGEIAARRLAEYVANTPEPTGQAKPEVDEDERVLQLTDQGQEEAEFEAGRVDGEFDAGRVIALRDWQREADIALDEQADAAPVPQLPPGPWESPCSKCGALPPSKAIAGEPFCDACGEAFWQRVLP